MSKRTHLGRSLVVLLVVAGVLFGATAAFAVGTDRATGARHSDVATERPVGRFAAWIVANTMEILDVNRGQIVSTLATGGTLADLAVGQGSSGEALTARLVAIAQARADEAVARGGATEEQAAVFMERITAAIDEAVFEPHHPGDRVRDRIRHHFDGIRRLLWRTTIDFLDVHRGDIIATFATGGTLADLAIDQGSSGEALVDVLVGVVDERLTVAVDAGVITQERKDEMLARAFESIETFVFTPHHPGRASSAA